MISCNNITKKFKNKLIFNNFNLTINENEFVCIYGPSGSGKSTLLNMIGTLEKPNKGFIEYNIEGVKYNSIKNYKVIRNKHINFIFQNFALLSDKTIKDNLLFAMQTESLNKEEKLELINNELSKVGLSDRLNSYVYELSGGEMQRIALVRAFLKSGNIILADEPTGSLDLENKLVIMEMLKEAHKNGATVIVVTHDFEFKKLATKIIEL